MIKANEAQKRKTRDDTMVRAVQKYIKKKPINLQNSGTDYTPFTLYLAVKTYSIPPIFSHTHTSIPAISHSLCD